MSNYSYLIRAFGDNRRNARLKRNVKLTRGAKLKRYFKRALLFIIAASVLSYLVNLIAEIAVGTFYVAASDGAADAASDTAQDIVDALNGDSLNLLLSSLSEKALTIFGGTDFVTVLTGIVSGNITLDYSGVLGYILSLMGTSLEGVMWLLVTIIAVAVLYSVIGGLKSKFSEETVAKTVHIASMIAILAVVASTTYVMIEACRNIVSSINNQMAVLFPIIFTLMTAIGASTTAAVYQPTLAVISSGIMQLLTSVIIPMILFAFVFLTVGSVSGHMKLGKMSEFVMSAVKWMMGMAFFLMCAFMSVQGITASVYDSISIRTAKMTISKYLPVIGSYLSDGLNLVLSGGVIVKNAVGYTAMILLILSILPIIVQLIVYSLVLKLAAAVTEPLGNEQMCKYLTGVSSLVNVMTALVIGAAFVYFIFILLIVLTGNISL